MIIGIGVDIVDMRRIQKQWEKHAHRFLDRLFTPYEQAYCLAKNQEKIRITDETTMAGNSFAKIFAAKEATLKAIGNTDGIDWHDIEIKHEDTGRPCIHLTGQAYINLKGQLLFLMSPDEDEKNVKFKTHLSLSDDIPYAIAQVIIEC